MTFVSGTDFRENHGFDHSICIILKILKISIGIITTQVSASLCNQRVSAEHDKFI